MDSTAPYEATSTFLFVVSHPRLVASAAAEEPASIKARWGPITSSSSSTEDSQPEKNIKQP